ncbi:hypothetical protein Cadr_000001513 [Camelus dromedarius]|uniref:Uncharacterized protein n=1 Tax=Camelus dromedarius TaxID=9838 RepID=A0A5N4EHM3_CAMDR|nr:hypothetical protein Cadr_000001513 [Camelus dromedarius]
MAVTDGSDLADAGGGIRPLFIPVCAPGSAPSSCPGFGSVVRDADEQWSKVQAAFSRARPLSVVQSLQNCVIA